MLDNYIKFFRVHERTILVLALLGVTLFSVNKYIDYESAKADARLQATNQTLAVQKEANDKLAVQNQQAQAQYQVLLGQINAQNARLSAEMLQLSQTLAARQKQDAALPMPELANRWENLLSLPTDSIISTVNGLQVSPDGARATVTSLESLPVLQKQLSDETQVADNRSKALDSSQAIVVGLQSQVSGLQLQFTDQTKQCDARVAVAKKSKWKYFKAGAVVGFVTGVLTGHYL